MDTQGVSSSTTSTPFDGSADSASLSGDYGGDSAESSTPAFGSASSSSNGQALASLDRDSRSRFSSDEQPDGTVDGEAAASQTDDATADVVDQVQQRLADVAADPDAFDSLLEQTFGQSYDTAQAEQIRQDTLNGDFGWMPDIEVVDASTLNDISGNQGEGVGYGAYSAETDTIYLNRDMVESDPGKAVDVLGEEIGHSLDARLTESDSAGDEGDIFSRLLGGDTISTEEMATLRADDDTGTIDVDGKEVEVEYSFLSHAFHSVTHAVSHAFHSVVDGVTDAVTGIVDSVTDVVSSAFDTWKDAWKSVGNLLEKAMESKWFQTVLTVAQFVPIPVVALVAKGVLMAESAYNVVQGVKNGSMSMVLSGVAGVAGGASSVGSALGASESFVNTASSVATWANEGAQAYSAASSGNFSDALGLASQAFTGTQVGDVLSTVQEADAVYEAVDDGDVLGALSLGSNLVSDLGYSDTGDLLSRVGSGAQTLSDIADTAKSGNWSGAASALMQNYGGELGLSTDAQQQVTSVVDTLQMADSTRQMIADGNYTSAALALYTNADDLGLSENAAADVKTAASTVGQLANISMLVQTGQISDAIEQGAALLGTNPSPQLQAHVDQLISGATSVEHFADTLKSGNIEDILGLLKQAA